MIEKDQLLFMIYQHACQLTIAGESVNVALSVAYETAAAAFDDATHEAGMKAALTRLRETHRSDGNGKPLVIPGTSKK